MPSAAAIRAGERVLARLGQASTLNGAPCGSVHLEQGVTVLQGEVALLKTVATISRVYDPQLDEVLVHDAGGVIGAPTTWKLDAQWATNGVNDRFILLPVTP